MKRLSVLFSWLVVSLIMACAANAAVQPSSWGMVKSLFADDAQGVAKTGAAEVNAIDVFNLSGSWELYENWNGYEPVTTILHIVMGTPSAGRFTRDSDGAYGIVLFFDLNRRVFLIWQTGPGAVFNGSVQTPVAMGGEMYSVTGESGWWAAGRSFQYPRSQK